MWNVQGSCGPILDGVEGNVDKSVFRETKRGKNFLYSGEVRQDE